MIENTMFTKPDKTHFTHVTHSIVLRSKGKHLLFEFEGRELWVTFNECYVVGSASGDYITRVCPNWAKRNRI